MAPAEFLAFAIQKGEHASLAAPKSPRRQGGNARFNWTREIVQASPRFDNYGDNCVQQKRGSQMRQCVDLHNSSKLKALPYTDSILPFIKLNLATPHLAYCNTPPPLYQRCSKTTRA